MTAHFAAALGLGAAGGAGCSRNEPCQCVQRHSSPTFRATKVEQAYAALMIGAIRSLTGDLETARARLDRIPFDSTPARVRVAAGFLAAAAVRIGDRRWAAELYERLLPDAERWQVLGFGGFAIEGTYARYLGGFAALLGKYDAAERHFEAALARAEAASAQPEIARIRAAYAAMLAARGRSDDGARAREIAAPPPPAPVATTDDLTISREGET